MSDNKRPKKLVPLRHPEDGYLLSDFLPALLVKLTNTWNKRFHQDLKKHDISVPRWRVLSVVCSRRGISIKEIAAFSTVEQPNASRIVDQFVLEGRMTRQVSDEDGRAVVIRSTEKGQALFQEIWPVALASYRKNAAPLTSREEATMVRLLRKLLDAAIA